MQTTNTTRMQRDHTALLARLAANPNYERRNAPELADTIENLATSFEEFKRRQVAEVEQIKTRMARPGASATPAPEAGPGPTAGPQANI